MSIYKRAEIKTGMISVWQTGPGKNSGSYD